MAGTPAGCHLPAASPGLSPPNRRERHKTRKRGVGKSCVALFMRQIVQVDIVTREILFGEPSDMVPRAAPVPQNLSIGLAGRVASGIHPILEILALEAMPAFTAERRLQRLGDEAKWND